ncbi:MAG TPA: sigma-70 family RNA polymerase sigma factor [Polyangiaceae bacterium]|nr:sigma-70 family RNA polymerase sigma factor [Polyangiaceae bacterium]
MVTGTRSPTRSGAGPTDAALVVAARAGERWAQEALFQRHARLVVGLAQRLLPRSADAEDLVQDAFVYAFRRLDTLKNPQAFASWIASITVRTASKRVRRQRLLARLGLHRSEPIDVDGLVASGAPADVASELLGIYTLLDRLPAEQRIALVLRRVEGMELTEIAEHMGLSLATVKRRLTVAEARLRRALHRE